jgi:NitT/TauT family transport system substrate-binding protein
MAVHRGALCAAAALLALVAASAPARSEEVRIGVGYGLAFLPIYLCEDLHLIEKHAKEAHLDLRVSYRPFLGAGPLLDAMADGKIDIGPFGTAPLLAQWERGKGTRRQLVAISGMTTLPLVLLSNRSGVRTISDLQPADRVAIPTATAPQLYLLQMQAEKVFGHYDRLRDQTVVMAPSAGVAALLSDSADAPAAYFASPPYTEIALEDARVHKVLSSTDVIGGKSSFLILAAATGYVKTHPKLPEVVGKAMDEAAKIIHDDPHRAAQIYLVHEPSMTLSVDAVETVINDVKDDFGRAVYGVQAFADFMGRHGALKSPPQSWKDIVAPALRNSPSS